MMVSSNWFCLILVTGLATLLKISPTFTIASCVSSEAAPEGGGDSSYVGTIVGTRGRGQYLVMLELGSPPSPFAAILDTGSDLLWRQCLPCSPSCYPQSSLPASVRQCAGAPTSRYSCRREVRGAAESSCYNSSASDMRIFDPTSSSSYAAADCSDPACLSFSRKCNTSAEVCTYHIVYIAPSAFTRGILSYDTLSILDPLDRHYASIPRFIFGCSHSSRAPYNFAGAGGIAGFGRGPLSLPSQLNISRFSYCLGAFNDTTNSPTPLLMGDAAILGGHGDEIQSTAIVPHVDYDYVVQIEAIRVDGRKLAIPTSSLGLNLTGIISTSTTHAGIVFDSGTTFTHLPYPAFIALRAAFSSAIAMSPSLLKPRNLSLCYQSEPIDLPSLSFDFLGASMDLPRQNYFISIDGVFCLAFMESSDELSILGNVQQQNYHILYNLQENTLSFKQERCNSLLRRWRANHRM
ncbi:hypothetical protein KP509_11G033600 [Ceratopteris richardii]|uniref:Peptidase A1 domain-containing protein n=1 Tax=Ceratopteris richardii TaxID=49495 RepID=A0A8T2TU65_CERRI|nr:hypothetical protein KP509_11G033600 [Ceratopteris richardii]